MKKIIAIALTLALLCGAVTVFADTELTVPSKTTGDLTSFEVVVENPVEGKKVTMAPAAAQDAAEAEIKKAQEAKTLEAYFGAEVTNAIKAILGDDAALSVDEFLAISAEGYEDGMGNATITAKFPTPYAKDEKVAVSVGIFDAEKNLTWTVFEGVGLEDGCVRFTVDPLTFAAIQVGGALLIACSK